MDAKDILDIAIFLEALDLLTVQQVYVDPAGDGLKQIEQAWDVYAELENNPAALLRSSAHCDFHWPKRDSQNESGQHQ
ncbi:MAG: hypothetical protein RLZZ571_564 [Actinomycetota bacterium]|jgi:hypothetical protein